VEVAEAEAEVEEVAEAEAEVEAEAEEAEVVAALLCLNQRIVQIVITIFILMGVMNSHKVLIFKIF
jgi:hypothetical protein